jgi:hypothetical protein
MRKYQKEQILELVKMIYEAHETIREYLHNQDYAAVEIILTDCQSAAIQIGEAIEKSEGENQPVIKDIEEYCENLYQISISLNNETCAEELYKILNRKMNCIEVLIKQDIVIHYEIVFLPYKASMWDSLESIWFAARDCDNCKCFVIPIPYFEKVQGNSVLHYEGERFPPFVPITHYDQYNLQINKPDIIYFHNPYDNFNVVTTVHPAFYSSELKKCTDMLVYVPYFITGGDFPEAMRELPVYYRIDKMMIQSEKIKEYLPKVFQDKLMAFGSPKADRIIYYEEHKPDLPSEWIKSMGNKESFSKRKLFLYNISISALLQEREKLLVKMRYVFSIFKGRRDALIVWRPHPLIKETLAAMIPKLLDEYCKIEQEFIDEKIGIYDTTPDITISVALADAYIGEESSSVVHLFRITGKPVFILNMNTYVIPTEEERDSLQFLDCDIEGNAVWFVADKYNVLCEMNINTGKTRVVGQIPDSLFGSISQYCDIIKLKDRVIMQPFKANAVCEYNLIESQFRKVYFDRPVNLNFNRIIPYKQYLFMIPKFYPAIVRIDTETGEYSYFTGCINELISLTDNYKEDEPLFIWGVETKDNLLFMASAQTNLVLEFNMDTEEYKFHRVGKSSNKYFGMAFDGNDYWMIPYLGKSIIRWNYETGKTIEYETYPKNFQCGNVPFRNIIACQGFMLAFPNDANMILKIDYINEIITQYIINLPYEEGNHKTAFYNNTANYLFAKRMNSSHIIAFTTYDNSLLIIDPLTNEYRKLPCRLEKQDRKHLLYRLLMKGPSGKNDAIIYSEDVNQTLDIFIDYVIDNKYHQKEKAKANFASVISNLDGTCGFKIHSYIMQELRKK